MANLHLHPTVAQIKIDVADQVRKREEVSHHFCLGQRPAKLEPRWLGGVVREDVPYLMSDQVAVAGGVVHTIVHKKTVLRRMPRKRA